MSWWILVAEFVSWSRSVLRVWGSILFRHGTVEDWWMPYSEPPGSCLEWQTIKASFKSEQTTIYGWLVEEIRMFCIEWWTVRKSELQLNTEAEESYKVQHRDVLYKNMWHVEERIWLFLCWTPIMQNVPLPSWVAYCCVRRDKPEIEWSIIWVYWFQLPAGVTVTKLKSRKGSILVIVR